MSNNKQKQNKIISNSGNKKPNKSSNNSNKRMFKTQTFTSFVPQLEYWFKREHDVFVYVRKNPIFIDYNNLKKIIYLWIVKGMQWEDIANTLFGSKDKEAVRLIYYVLKLFNIHSDIFKRQLIVDDECNEFKLWYDSENKAALHEFINWFNVNVFNNYSNAPTPQSSFKKVRDIQSKRRIFQRDLSFDNEDYINWLVDNAYEFVNVLDFENFLKYFELYLYRGYSIQSIDDIVTIRILTDWGISKDKIQNESWTYASSVLRSFNIYTGDDSKYQGILTTPNDYKRFLVLYEAQLLDLFKQLKQRLK